MSQIVESIDVDVPVRAAYDQWTRFESFPLFMDGVEQVVQVDDTTLVWRARIAGVRREWGAKILEQTPDERIAWSSVNGAKNAGMVSFHPIDDRRCRITLQLDLEPGGAIEAVGDLQNFRRYVEAHGQKSGARRGAVVGGGVQ